MPNPGKNESQKDFVSRCIPIVMDEGTAKDQKQAAAICYSKWREHKKEQEQQEAQSFFQAIKDFFTKDKSAKEVEAKHSPHPFMVWKEEDTGRYRWLAVYSNKFRDSDHPPEILADAAHRDFVDAVDKGEWPMPELWLWHVSGTKSGVADYVAYDDSGFAIASGVVDEGRESVAYALSKMDDLATSHGMPVAEIQRDTVDPSVITRYRTQEISPLPYEAAANKHGTGFVILPRKEDNMALPDRKRPFLEEVMGKEGLANFEKDLADKAEALKEEGIEFKENDVEEQEQVTEEVEQEQEPKEEAAEAAPEATPEPKFVTEDQLVEAFGALKPLMERIDALTELVDGIGKEVKEQKAIVSNLREEDEIKIQKELAATPAASLGARIASVIGSSETLVDGRTSLAKDGPQQVKEEDEANGPTPVGLINEFIARSYKQ